MPFYFANPIGLWALLALPAIVGIHLYHRRFPPLQVAGLHLWSVETEVRLSGRRRDTLPLSKSLLFELLAALLLALTLAQPRWSGFDHMTHLAVVLDNSASMQGHAANEPTSRDAAIAELERRCTALGRRCVVSVILTGRRPVMLAGPAVPWSEAKEKLATWQPNLPRHQFASAWDLARQLVEQSGELLFITDQIPESGEIPATMEIVSVGRRAPNVAIATARWNFDSASAKGLVYVRLENHGPSTEATLRARAGDKEVFEKKIELGADSSSALELPVPGGLQTLVLEVSAPGDGLALDNHVTLVEPTIRTVHVVDELPAGVSRDILERTLRVTPDVGTAPRDKADLIIAPGGTLPESRSQLWWLGVGPLDPEESARKAAKDLVGPFLIDKRHPLVDGISLGGVVWGGVQPVTIGVSPLISSGNTPLLAQLSGTRTTGYLLNIDLSRSNLSESPDWPILIDNLIELRRDDLPGLRRWNYRLGEDVRFKLFDGEDPAPSNALTLHRGTQSKTLVRSGLIELPWLEQTGLYEIHDGEAVFGRFAVNFFDPDESNLLHLMPGIKPPATQIDGESAQFDNPYSRLMLLGAAAVLAFVFADWFVLRQRDASFRGTSSRT